MNLNQVTLAARNLEESVAFYKAMGFKQIVSSDGYARFECPEGDSTFSLEQKTCDSIRSGVVIYFEVSDLPSTYNQLIEKGFKFNSKPKEEEWLWSEARLSDPSGNEICIYYAGENRKNPPWRINA